MIEAIGVCCRSDAADGATNQRAAQPSAGDGAAGESGAAPPTVPAEATRGCQALWTQSGSHLVKAVGGVQLLRCDWLLAPDVLCSNGALTCRTVRGQPPAADLHRPTHGLGSALQPPCQGVSRRGYL